MRTIEKTLEEFLYACDKLDDAASVKMHEVLNNNEESIKLNDLNGKYTGITITKPEDMRDMIAGSIIVLDGTEWMLRNDSWVSCFGGECTHDGMFVNILRNHDHVFLLHKGY